MSVVLGLIIIILLFSYWFYFVRCLEKTEWPVAVYMAVYSFDYHVYYYVLYHDNFRNGIYIVSHIWCRVWFASVVKFGGT